MRDNELLSRRTGRGICQHRVNIDPADIPLNSDIQVASAKQIVGLVRKEQHGLVAWQGLAPAGPKRRWRQTRGEAG